MTTDAKPEAVGLETLDREAQEAEDLTNTILRFYGYTDEDIATANAVHPGRVCDEDECWDENGQSIHPPVYDEAGATAATVVEIVMPWIAARDEQIRAHYDAALRSEAVVEAAADVSGVGYVCDHPIGGPVRDDGECARCYEIARLALNRAAETLRGGR